MGNKQKAAAQKSVSSSLCLRPCLALRCSFAVLFQRCHPPSTLLTTVCAALISRCCQQIIEDKTFGLKNKKKSKKVQNYVNQVVNATKASFVDHKKKKEEDAKAAAKAEKKKHKEEMADLFKASIIQPKVPFGVDPKTIACAFFKAGQCKKKGDACKAGCDCASGKCSGDKCE